MPTLWRVNFCLFSIVSRRWINEAGVSARALHGLLKYERLPTFASPRARATLWSASTSSAASAMNFFFCQCVYGIRAKSCVIVSFCGHVCADVKFCVYEYKFDDECIYGWLLACKISTTGTRAPLKKPVYVCVAGSHNAPKKLVSRENAVCGKESLFRGIYARTSSFDFLYCISCYILAHFSICTMNECTIYTTV